MKYTNHLGNSSKPPLNPIESPSYNIIYPIKTPFFIYFPMVFLWFSYGFSMFTIKISLSSTVEDWKRTADRLTVGDGQQPFCLLGASSSQDLGMDIDM